MTVNYKKSLEQVSKIFNKLNKERIEAFEPTDENYKKIQREIVDIYRDEKKYNALKVYELTSSTGVLDPHDLQDQILAKDLKQDFLINDQYDDYSLFVHTDGDPKFCRISFAGFTKFELQEYDEENNVIYTPYKRFNVFKASIFKNYETNKIYVFLKFNNRRRNRNSMNFFNTETEFVKMWFRENFAYRLKAVNVRDIYFNHRFDTEKFEPVGYNVSDILDDRDETLPVDLKFRPNDRNLRPEDIYSYVNKKVLPSLVTAFTEVSTSLFGELDQATRDKLDFQFRGMNFSKLFFESAHKAFESGVGHLKYLKKVENYDKTISFRFDFPADENGVIKIDIMDSGQYMSFIYDEINKYLSSR